MKLTRAFAGQAVYHDFIVSPTTCVPAKRLHAAYLVAARLDLDRLDVAVRGVVAAHDSLRTDVENIDGRPTQVIREPDEITDSALRVARWDGTATDTARLVGALDDWWTVPRPLAMQVIAAHGPGEQTLVVCVFNHASSDGISAELVFDQIRLAYQRSADGPRHDTVPQFTAYFAGLVNEGTIEAYDDWLHQIERSAPAVPRWMLEEKLATRQVQIRTHAWEFAPDSVRGLRQLARAHVCTEFEVMAACVGLYFRRDDGAPVAIGVTHSGRHRPGGLAVAGLLRSQVVDVIDHDGLDTAAAAIDTRRDELRAVLAHQGKLPSDEVCRLSGRSAGWFAGQAGLWEVEVNGMFAPGNLEPFDGAEVRIADVPLPENAECENGGPLFLLSFVFGADSVHAALRYVTPPVDEELARTVATGIESVLHVLRDRPQSSVRDVPALYEIAGSGALVDRT